MNSLAHTSATTTTALGTPCQAPLPTWEENAHSIRDENEISLGEIVVDADVKSDCTAPTAIKRDRAPTLENHAVAFEPFWDPNEASFDSIVDESDDVAAARIALDFDQMFGGHVEAENAPAASEPQQAVEAPANAQRKYYNYNSKFGACQISARDMTAIEEKDAQIAATAAASKRKYYHHDSKFGECQISLRDMAAIEEKDAQIAADAAKAEAARAKIVAEAAEAAAAIEQQRAFAKRKATIEAALAAEQIKIKAAAAAAAIAAATAAAEAKMAADEAALVAEAAVIEQQHALAEARAATDAAAAVLAQQQHEFAEAAIATAVAAATMVANVAFGACAAASAAYITEKAKTRPVIVEQAKAHAAVRAFMAFMATVADSSTALEFQRNENKAKQGVRNRQRAEEKQQKQKQKLQEKLDQQQKQQTQQNHVYRPLAYKIATIWEEFEIDGPFKAVAREVPEAPTAPIKAPLPHCPAPATAATGRCRLSRSQKCNRTRANAIIPIKNAVKVKLTNVLAEARYLGAAVAPKRQPSARQPFVSAHSKVVKVNANTDAVRVHAPQLAGKHVALMIVNAAHVFKAGASMAFGSTTARFAAAAR